MSSSKFLPSSRTESEIEKITDFEKFGLKLYTLEPTKSKVPVAYGRNSVSDLASSSDVATNGVNGRTGNKTWCKCECCTPVETSTGVCCLEIPEICKRRFLSISCLSVSQLAHNVITTLSFGYILVATSDNVVTTLSQRRLSDVVTKTEN